MMKTLIVDDSRLARKELVHLLKDLGEVTVVGEAANVEEALEKIRELDPELIFLDIQMPGQDGFQLLEQLEDPPEVIFTTAYDQYAIKAFEYNALDYLQKPLRKDRIMAAVAKVSEKLMRAERRKEASGRLTASSQVFVKDGERCWFVKLGSIRLFEVDGSYTTIHFEDCKPMIPRTLNYLEARLDPDTFFRANRQQMINLQWVDRIEPWFGGGIRIHLKGGAEIEVSRRQASRFKELMSL